MFTRGVDGYKDQRGTSKGRVGTGQTGTHNRHHLGRVTQDTNVLTCRGNKDTLAFLGGGFNYHRACLRNGLIYWVFVYSTSCAIYSRWFTRGAMAFLLGLVYTSMLLPQRGRGQRA